MGLFSFGKKKKKPARSCDLEGSLLEFGEGYLLTSSQIIKSKRFWDNKMVEPETLAYSKAHFERNDEMGTKMRTMIFQKYSSKEQPWLVGDGQVNQFEIDKNKAREYAQQWWESEFKFMPPEVGSADKNLSEAEYQEWREYAIMKAGEAQLKKIG
ncbi:MAG: hypothetical protein HWE07_11960 [Cytophagia bacterium]|nr:hypothetical protein [Cytophagia bacterium]